MTISESWVWQRLVINEEENLVALIDFLLLVKAESMTAVESNVNLETIK